MALVTFTVRRPKVEARVEVPSSNLLPREATGILLRFKAFQAGGFPAPFAICCCLPPAPYTPPRTATARTAPVLYMSLYKEQGEPGATRSLAALPVELMVCT